MSFKLGKSGFFALCAILFIGVFIYFVDYYYTEKLERLVIEAKKEEPKIIPPYSTTKKNDVLIEKLYGLSYSHFEKDVTLLDKMIDIESKLYPLLRKLRNNVLTTEEQAEIDFTLKEIERFLTNKNTIEFFKVLKEILDNPDFYYQKHDKIAELSEFLKYLKFFKLKLIYQFCKNADNLQVTLNETRSFINRYKKSKNDNLLWNFYSEHALLKVFDSLLSEYECNPKNVDAVIKFFKQAEMYGDMEYPSKIFNNSCSYNLDFNHSLVGKNFVLNDDDIKNSLLNIFVDLRAFPYNNYVLNKRTSFYNTNHRTETKAENFITKLIVKKDLCIYFENIKKYNAFFEKMTNNKITKADIDEFSLDTSYISGLFMSSPFYTEYLPYSFEYYFKYKKLLANFEIKAYKAKNGESPKSLSEIPNITLSPYTGENFEYQPLIKVIVEFPPEIKIPKEKIWTQTTLYWFCKIFFVFMIACGIYMVYFLIMQSKDKG